MRPHPTTTLATGLRAACTTHAVVLAYLFGSHARGTADRDSDIDVAVLLADGLSPAERHRARLQLAVEFSRVLRVPLERLEVVVLQDVTTLLRYNAIRHGVLLYQLDVPTRKAFEVAVERRFDDEHPERERETRLTLRRILAARA